MVICLTSSHRIGSFSTYDFRRYNIIITNQKRSAWIMCLVSEISLVFYGIFIFFFVITVFTTTSSSLLLFVIYADNAMRNHEKVIMVAMMTMHRVCAMMTVSNRPSIYSIDGIFLYRGPKIFATYTENINI